MGSFVLVVLIWLCKSNGDKQRATSAAIAASSLSAGINNEDDYNKTAGKLAQLNLNNCSEFELHDPNVLAAEVDPTGSPVQTQMYLMSDQRQQLQLHREHLEPRLAAYHNHSNGNERGFSDPSWPTLAGEPNQYLFHYQQGTNKAIQLENSSSNGAYTDFLIIDPTIPVDTTNEASKHQQQQQLQQQAILLIPDLRNESSQSQHSTTLISPLCANQQQAYNSLDTTTTDSSNLNSKCPSKQEGHQYHIEPMIHLNGENQLVDEENAILRTFYNGTNQNLCLAASNTSNRCNKLDRDQNNVGLNLESLVKGRLIRSPINLIPPSTLNGGYNLELNSLGELTLTDESSSFIHDDGTIVTDQQTLPACNQCLADAAKQLSRQSRGSERSNTTGSCIECHRQIMPAQAFNLRHRSREASSPLSVTFLGSPGTSDKVDQEGANTLRRRAAKCVGQDRVELLDDKRRRGGGGGSEGGWSSTIC